MTEQELIKMKLGRNPMLTPDGYFDSFTERLMQQLPAKPTPAVESAKPSMHIAVRRFMRYAAAIVVAAFCIGAGTYIYTHQSVSTQDSIAALSTSLANVGDEDLSDEYIDEALDYECINNSDLAYYLTEAY